MKEAEIAQLFDHIGHRQELYGAEKAFRFKSFKHKTKGILPARYPNAVDDGDESDAGNVDKETNPAAKQGRCQTRRKKAAKAVATNKDQQADAGEQEQDGEPQHDAGVVHPQGKRPDLLPTPQPSPIRMTTTDTCRPKPRPKVNPNPTRIQPTRKGKGN